MFLGIHKFMIYNTIASLCILLWSFSSNAIEPAKNSDKIKAAFLLHFTGYTTWPSIKTEQVNICLLGEVSFDSFLKSMVKAKPENRVGQKLNVLYILLVAFRPAGKKKKKQNWKKTFCVVKKTQ